MVLNSSSGNVRIYPASGERLRLVKPPVLTRRDESAHEPAVTKDRAATLPHGVRPRHSCHVAGLVGDPGDSSCPGSISPSSPASQLVMAISCRDRRLRGYLRSGLVSAGSSSRASQRGSWRMTTASLGLTDRCHCALSGAALCRSHFHQPSVLSPASCIITGRRFSFISRHGGPREAEEARKNGAKRNGDDGQEEAHDHRAEE
jgi:hypothetical protein